MMTKKCPRTREVYASRRCVVRPKRHLRTAVFLFVLSIWQVCGRRLETPVNNTRRLDESFVWGRLNSFGAYKVNMHEELAMQDMCLDQDYAIALFQEEAHFFLGAVAPESAPSECLSLGFASILGENTMLKGEYGHIARFDFDKGPKFVSLRDILAAFRKATPVSKLGFLHEEDTCIHFASRIWRALGVSETKELGDFIVMNVLRDVPDEMITGPITKILGGAIGVLVKFAKRKIIERAVFSYLRVDAEGRALVEDAFADEMSEFGLQYGFDRRHLEGDCRNLIYNVDLLVVGSALIFVEPASEALAVGCSAFLLYTTIDSVSKVVEKEVMRFEEGIPPHDELAQHHATIIEMEAEPLSTIVHAFYEASVYPPGGNYSDDLTVSNPGDFVANFLSLLGHTSSHEESLVIAAGMMLSDPNIAETLRVTANSTDISDMTDLELLEWVVENRTEPMYNTTG